MVIYYDPSYCELTISLFGTILDIGENSILTTAALEVIMVLDKFEPRPKNIFFSFLKAEQFHIWIRTFIVPI